MASLYSHSASHLQSSHLLGSRICGLFPATSPRISLIYLHKQHSCFMPKQQIEKSITVASIPGPKILSLLILLKIPKKCFSHVQYVFIIQSCTLLIAKGHKGHGLQLLKSILVHGRRIYLAVHGTVYCRQVQVLILQTKRNGRY